MAYEKNRDILIECRKLLREIVAKSEARSPMDTGKQVVVAGEKYVIPDNWQSEPPPGFVYDTQDPGTGNIWIYNPQTGERKAIPACEGGL